MNRRQTTLHRLRRLTLVALLSICMQGVLAQTWTEVSTKEELTAAVADGAHIRLTADITLSAYLRIGETGTQTVTIDLNHHTLSRSLSSLSSDGHIIEVFKNGRLTLDNGTLSGGRAENGGGICNFGTLVMNNITVTDCKAINGGGIHNKADASLTIYGSNITNCRSDAGGGAIVNHGMAYITDCKMTGNIATTRGGAVYTDGPILLKRCTLSNNEALANGGNDQNEGNGGAIHVNNNQTTLVNTTITNNKSKDAGAIYVDTEGILVVSGEEDGYSTISDNSSTQHGGGGIVNQGTVSLHDNVRITGNTCKTNGGGIWNNGFLKMYGDIQVKDNTSDDVYLKPNKTIDITHPLTSGPNSIGIHMEAYRGVFTSGYASSGTEVMPFFPCGTINQVSVANNECRLEISYYECSWDESNDSVIHTIRTVPASQSIKNLCNQADFPSEGRMDGNTYWFVVQGSVDLTNQGVACAGSNVHLILCDNSSFKINNIDVREGTTLHIYSQSYGGKMGKLESNTTEPSMPGIGAREGHTGNIIIHGGNITAKGATYGAGIGGREDKSSKNITIWDGKIEATGGENAAGIGGGEGGSSDGTILIYGGDIKATGGSCAAGIGGGQYSGGGGNNNRIEIYGGTVEAKGCDRHWDDPDKACGAGIGSGYKGTQIGPIIIHGGIVSAKGGEHAAGIGGGTDSGGGVITINGGIVDAHGGLTGAAIGGGVKMGSDGGNGGTITINGGFVIANTHNEVEDGTESMSAAIGGGAHAEGGTITINDGIVFAVSDKGAAIGSGLGANGGNITINGGSVVAQSVTQGAGIGGGHGEEVYNGGTITITGGEVMAFGGAKEHSHGQTSVSWRDLILDFFTNLKYRFLRGGIIADLVNEATIALAKALTHSWQPSTYGGAGIGGGLHGDGGTIKITGGHVVAQGGTSGCNAIGHGKDRSNAGSLFIYELAKVSAGTDEKSYTLKNKADKVSACRNNLFTVIDVCDHPNATYTWTGTTENDTHTRDCPNCSDQTTELHNFAGGATCTVCGVSGSFPIIEMQDNGNNYGTINKANGKLVQSVTLANRTLYKDGSWNTICLPFNMTAEQIAANSYFAGAELMKLSESSYDYATCKLALKFVPITSIEAGVPHIVKWTSGSDVTNPVFTLVTINNTIANTSTEYIDFIGTYSPDFIYETGDKTKLYLGSNNKLHHPISEGYTIKSCRGYFQLKKGLKVASATPEEDMNSVKAFVLNFGDETINGITEISADSSPYPTLDKGWYTIDGRKLSSRPTQKGIYIHNGQKVVKR